MLIIFIHIKGIVYKQFVLADQTVNSEYFCDFYGDCVKMCEDFAPTFLRQKYWLLQNDNAPPHVSLHQGSFYQKAT
jgi:hypothetical protein